MLIALDGESTLPYFPVRDEGEQDIVEKLIIDSCLEFDPGEGPQFWLERRLTTQQAGEKVCNNLVFEDEATATCWLWWCNLLSHYQYSYCYSRRSQDARPAA